MIAILNMHVHDVITTSEHAIHSIFGPLPWCFGWNSPPGSPIGRKQQWFSVLRQALNNRSITL